MSELSAKYDRHIEGLQQEVAAKPKERTEREIIGTLMDFLEPFEENCAEFLAELETAIWNNSKAICQEITSALAGKAGETYCQSCIQDGHLRKLEPHTYECDGRTSTFMECVECEGPFTPDGEEEGPPDRDYDMDLWNSLPKQDLRL